MSVNRDEERRVCAECHADDPEESLCAYCQLHLAGDRAGRALLDIAIASGEWDGHPDGPVEVDLVDLGHFMIDALITPGRCPEELVKALEYAGFTRDPRDPGIGDDRTTRTNALDLARDALGRCCRHLEGEDDGLMPGDLVDAIDALEGTPEALALDALDLCHRQLSGEDHGLTTGDLADALNALASRVAEERQERVATAVEKTAANCPDDLGHVPGPGRPI